MKVKVHKNFACSPYQFKLIPSILYNKNLSTIVWGKWIIQVHSDKKKK